VATDYFDCPDVGKNDRMELPLSMRRFSGVDLPKAVYPPCPLGECNGSGRTWERVSIKRQRMKECRCVKR